MTLRICCIIKLLAFVKELITCTGMLCFKNIFIRSDDMNNMAEDVAFEEFEFGYEVPGNDGVLEGPDIDKEIQPGIQKVSDDDGCRQLTTATKCIAFTSQILELTKINIPECKELSCKKQTRIVESFVVSAMYLKWVCVYLKKYILKIHVMNIPFCLPFCISFILFDVHKIYWSCN